MESWKKGRLRGMREAESRARLAHLLVRGCVRVWRTGGAPVLVGGEQHSPPRLARSIRLCNI